MLPEHDAQRDEPLPETGGRMTVETSVPAESVEAKAPGPSLRSILVTWARRVLLLAVVAGAAYYLVTRWDEVWSALRTVPVTSALLSMVAVIAGIMSGTFGWQAIVDDLGAPVGRVRGSQIFLVSQLGKYVPGAVW